MTDLGDILGAQIHTKAPAPALSDQLGELVQRYGSKTAAANALGISRKSWWRLETGQARHPRASTLDKVSSTLRAKIAKDTAPSSVGITFKYDGRNRPLTFTERKRSEQPGTKTLKPGTGARMADAAGRGDKGGVARAFIEGVEDQWYRDAFDDAYEANNPAGAGEGSDSVGAFA